MMCRELGAEELVAWLDGESSSAAAERIAAHVAACTGCRREAFLLRASGQALRRLPLLAASAGFEARVLAAARADAERGAPRGRLRWLRPLSVAAAAAVLVTVSGAWWLGSRPSTETLSARDEEAVAEDLALLSNLDALQSADSHELAQIAEELDVLEGVPTDEDG